MSRLRHLPNAITVLRLASVPVAVWLLVRHNLAAAFWIFVAASLTDAVDGLLARLLRAQSAFGSYLDALADKLLLVSVYLSLAVLGLLSWWLVGVVVCRDVLLVAFAVGGHLTGRQSEVQPLMISKVNTLAQILLVIVVLVGRERIQSFVSWPARIFARSKT